MGARSRCIRRLITLSLVLGAALVGCGGQEVSETEVVRIWHAYRGAERAALEHLVGDFNRDAADLQIETLAVPSQAYKSRLSAAIPRGNGPDLFIEAHELVGEWSRAGLLAPPPGEELGSREDYPPAVLDALRFGGQQWGVPLSVKSVALLYRPERFPSPPSSLEELLEWGRSSGLVPLAYEGGELYYQAALVHAHGGRVLSPDGEVLLDRPEVVAAFEGIAAMAKRGDLPAEADGAMVSTLLQQDEVAFVINGPWALGELRPDSGVSVAPLPPLAATGKALRPFLTVEALFRAAGGRASPAGLAKVSAALTSRAAAVTRAALGRQVPARRSAREAPELRADPALLAFARQSDAALPMPNRPEMGVVWEPAGRALRAVLRGSMTAEEALVRAQREAESYLRAPPEPADSVPYVVAGLLLLLCGLLGFVLWARRTQAFARAVAARHAYLYLLPAALGVGCVVFLPFVVGSSVSLFAHRDGSFTFVGLDHFVSILSARETGLWDPLSFWFTLGVTVLWTAVNVGLHVGIGLALALLLREPWMRLKGVYRVLLILPWAVPNYITALIWKGMFNEQFGAINGVLVAMGYEPVAWFSRWVTSFAANVCTNTWLGFPFMMVVCLGALQSIPRDLEEAAMVDGAGAWDRFRHIILPLLRPVLLPAVVLGSVWTFNMFNIIYLVSGGEPDGGTEILISEAYKWAFSRQAQYGYASAYALLVFGILLLYAAGTKAWLGRQSA